LGSLFVRKAHLVSIGVAILIVLAVGALSYRDWLEYEQNADRAAQVRDTVEQAQQLLSLLTDAETGQRGYLLTGDDAYLGIYRESVPQIREIRLYEGGLRRADPADAAQLNRLVAEKLAELARTIEIRREGHSNEALAIVRTNQGKRTMDEIRAVAARLIGAEDRRLRAREAAAHQHEDATRIAIFGGTGLLALLLLGSGIHVDRLFVALDRSRSNEQLHRAKLATTLHSIGDGVIATDKTGVITFANPVAESLTGWRVDEAIGRRLATVFPIIGESTRERASDPVAKVLETGSVVGLANHTLLISRDGREIPIDDSGSPIKDESGRMTGVVLVFRDATESRRAQQQLEESERRYRLLFENNPQPMWVFDAETLAFLAVNYAAIETYGYTREEFLSITLRDIRPVEDIPALMEDVRSREGRPLHRSGPWRHRKKDGTLITIEIVSHPIDFGGRKARLVLASDITERKKLEEQFHQAQRLESIGRLAGGVAHDFNNLLTVINGYTEMVLQDESEDDPNREMLDEVLAAGARAAALTQQLLTFSRKQLIQPVVVNLNDIVSDIERMLRRLIGEDVRLVTKLSGDLGRVKADGGQLQQVIMNLAINARDAMPNGGSLLLEAANVTFDEEYATLHPEVPGGEYVMLAVTDTGTGMTPEVKARLFEPFFTTKPKGSGTGLGLATVYGIVKQSGGWIWVYSEPGNGTTFKIYLPRTDEAIPQPRPVLKTDARGRETILVVEDQLEVRTIAIAALQRFGYTVLSAVSGEEALSIASGFLGRIDLLLTDVVMPGMNGRDLAWRLRVERADIRVLLMSGYTENAMADRADLDAEFGYVQKPFTPDTLAEKVREALGPRTASTKILIVDDDESVRRLLRNMLTAAGYGVWEAANGRQAAVHIAANGDVDLVLSDLAMPEQEGLELIRELRSSRPTLKVIAMTGAFEGDFLPVAKSLGAAATLRKPVVREDLLRAVREVLNPEREAAGRDGGSV
jgi:two-component system, cell cycle sensor histidine kinase and response regulator CckA